MVYREWLISKVNSSQSEVLQKEWGISKLVADILLGRQLENKVGDFLEQGLDFPSPFLLTDMNKAVGRIQQALENAEKIVVFGDYDADGITATALLFSHLESMGAKVYYKLPNRNDDGYGLSISLVEEMAGAGVTLIITVDSGISAYAEVEKAKQLGVDVIVTDHHLPPNQIPDAIAVVDPMCDEFFPEKHLAGVGVAFQLICALENCPAEEMLDFYADLVAIGTIADIMPLTGINHRIAKYGIELLQDTHRPGIAALLEQVGLAGKKITAENISYALTPRLNAAGRMKDATVALRLLLTDDFTEAEEIAAALDEQNQERQQTEQEIVQTVIKQIDADVEYKNQPVIVVWGENFHQGVIGIVASRVVEKFGKPAIVISLENGEGKGSGRSVDGFSLYNAIVHCQDILIRFGGHDLAAGLSITQENLEKFRNEINHYAKKELQSFVRKPIRIDTAISLEALTVEQVSSLATLAPYGSGNPPPLFIIENAVIDGIYPVQDGRHTRIRLRQEKICLYGILFGVEQNKFPYKQGDKVDAVVSLSVYCGQAGSSISARIKELRPTGVGNEYVKTTGHFEKMNMGASLSQEQKTELCPSREEIAEVYKILAKQAFFLSDLRPLFAKLPTIPAGRIQVAVAALEELGIIETTETAQLQQVQVAGKRNLADSTVLQKLQ